MRADHTSVYKQFNVDDSEEIIRKHGVVEFIEEREIEYFTSTCSMCDGVGRYDARSEVVCEDCGNVISQDADMSTFQIYSDKYSQSSNDPESGTGNRGGSGHPMMRSPALADPGPSGDDKMS